MPTLRDVFRELNTLKHEQVVVEYAVGGATAMLFFVEPTRTYDVDVFVLLESQGASGLVSLDRVYEWARGRGYPEHSEHVMIHGVPVQFLPAHNALAEEAIVEALTMEYDGEPVRVIGPEHLAALAFQAGGSRRRERAWQLVESDSCDRRTVEALLEKHGISVRGQDGI